MFYRYHSLNPVLQSIADAINENLNPELRSGYLLKNTYLLAQTAENPSHYSRAVRPCHGAAIADAQDLCLLSLAHQFWDGYQRFDWVKIRFFLSVACLTLFR